MSMTDPIADMLTRLRNAMAAKKDSVRVPFSRLKSNILELLHKEGYLKGFEVLSDGGKKNLLIYLKYSERGVSVMRTLRRISKPGCRIYRHIKDFKPVKRGIGMAVVSTPKGVLSDRQCRELKIGGEILCEVF